MVRYIEVNPGDPFVVPVRLLKNFDFQGQAAKEVLVSLEDIALRGSFAEIGSDVWHFYGVVEHQWTKVRPHFAVLPPSKTTAHLKLISHAPIS